MNVSIDEFKKIDIRVGTVIDAKFYLEAKKPAIKLWIDFGEELGLRKSSAQLIKYYEPNGIIGYQVLAVVNLPPRQIGKFLSEVLVLGLVSSKGGVILIVPDSQVSNGTRLY